MWQSHYWINSTNSLIKKNHKCVTEKKSEDNFISQRWAPHQISSQPPIQVSNPFLPFLKPNFPPAPHPLEPQLYRGEAKQFAN